jgi:hypothetical protein
VFSYASIITDGSGNVWVALNTNDGTLTHVEVWKYTGVSWSKVDDINPLPQDATPILEPLTSGIALIYGEGSVTGQVSVITTASGTSWSSPLSPLSKYALFSSSATSIGNNLYFVGLASSSTGVTSGTIDFWSFAYGGSSISAETILQGTSSSWMATLSEEQSNTLIVYYGQGTNIYSSYSVSGGATWSASALTISSSEASVAGLSAGYANSAAVWISGTASPFNVRFNALPVLTVTSETNFAVHLISLYVSYPAGNSLVVHYDTNPTGPGVSGSFDFWIGPGEEMSIPLRPFSWSTSHGYFFTLSTSQGTLATSSFTSPS